MLSLHSNDIISGKSSPTVLTSTFRQSTYTCKGRRLDLTVGVSKCSYNLIGRDFFSPCGVGLIVTD